MGPKKKKSGGGMYGRVMGLGGQSNQNQEPRKPGAVLPLLKPQALKSLHLSVQFWLPIMAPL